MPREKTLDEYQNELKNISSNYTLLGVERSPRRNRNIVIVKHDCGEIFKTEFAELKRTISRSKSGGCPRCAKVNRLKNLSKAMTMKRFRDEIFPNLPDSNNYRILTTDIDLVAGNKTKIQFQHVCEKCNNHVFEMTINDFQQGYRCPECGKMYVPESKTAVYSKNYIKETLKKSYITEGTLPGCQLKLPLRFDILFPEERIVIEIDGEQHFVQKTNREKLEMIRERDIAKNNYCKDNKYILLRIPYTEEKHYKTILNHFFKKEYGFLIKYKIMLISQDITIHTENYFEINK